MRAKKILYSLLQLEIVNKRNCQRKLLLAAAPVAAAPVAAAADAFYFSPPLVHPRCI